MSNFAYWISHRGQIMTPDTRHIGAIISKPIDYGETKKTLQVTFDEHGEKMSKSVEGKAREEIMLRVIKRGYIRIRKGGTRRNQRWSIQLTRLNSKNRDYLWEWARKMLDSRVETDKWADVTIHQLGKGDKMTKTNIGKIASGEQIRENTTRIYTQAEAEAEWVPYFDDAHEYIDQLHEDAVQELVDRGYLGNVINEHISLDESSLSRIFTHIRQAKRSFGVMSASRKELSKKENKDNYLELKKAVRTLGYGFIEMKGGFREPTGFTEEESLFIPSIKKKELIDLGKKYNQYSVIYKDDDEFTEYGTTSEAGVGKAVNKFDWSGRDSLVLAQDAMKDFFSKLLKGSHRGKKFLFKLQEKEVASFNRVAYGEPLEWKTIYEEK